MPSDLLEVWYDSTCHSPNIHFPVDWVQLGDCCRSLLKATLCIRKHGIKNRMAHGGAKTFLSNLNQQLIALGNARRRKDSKKQRKKGLRLLKKFAKRVEHHARTHRDLLSGQREEKTNLSEGQARVITERIDKVLEQLPGAIKQAHERIIGERRVPNSEKILSIYEPAIKVYVRGKSGAEVEYGNQLLLGENREGLITYYDLFEDVKADSARLPGVIEATEQSVGEKLRLAVGDRGFSDEKVRVALAESRPELVNHCCAKSPVQLEEQQKDSEFRASQKRRAQTEARIAILINCYQRGRSLSKGLESQRQELHWVVLAHNVRLLARKRLAEQRERQRQRQRQREKERRKEGQAKRAA
jgi:IS5 family transposase